MSMWKMRKRKLKSENVPNAQHAKGVLPGSISNAWPEKKEAKEKKKQVFSRLATTPSPAVHSPARVASQSATM
jgi:hypothetical protein